jgi:hypothetical protein
MKLRSIIIWAAIPMALLLQGCVSSRDISSQVPYSELIGKKFVLQQNCYVYWFKENKSPLSVGIDETGNGQFLPNKVNAEFIQKELKYVRISGIMPKGSVFTIVGCIEERRPEDTFRRFKATFENTTTQWGVLDVSDLTDMSKSPPEFLENLAKPVE